MKSRIESLGLYLPERIQSTSELVNSMINKPAFDLEAITGIKTRRVRADNEDSFTIALAAARDCLANSSLKARDLEAIFFCSITRYKGGLVYRFEPAMSLALKRALGADKAMVFDISNACAGMMTGVYTLDMLIRTGVLSNGLVVSGEAITTIADTAVKEIREPLDLQFGSLTVGDSGAAMILERATGEGDGIHFVDFVTIAQFADYCYGMPSEENAGVVMYSNSTGLHRETYRRWASFLDQVLRRNGSTYRASDYDFIVMHQTAVRSIINYRKNGEEYFGEPMPHSLVSVDEFGNTSSTNHALVLYRNLQNRTLGEGSRGLLVVLGSGIGIGCLSMTLGKLEVGHDRCN